MKTVKTKQLRVGDVVRSKTYDAFTFAYTDMTVKEVTDFDVTLFRPYVHVSPKNANGVFCYVGTEEVRIALENEIEFILLASHVSLSETDCRRCKLQPRAKACQRELVEARNARTPHSSLFAETEKTLAYERGYLDGANKRSEKNEVKPDALPDDVKRYLELIAKYDTHVAGAKELLEKYTRKVPDSAGFGGAICGIDSNENAYRRGPAY